MQKPNRTQLSYSILNILAPFGIGGLSGSIATFLIQPIDMLKVQIQIVSEQIGKSLSPRPQVLQILKKIHKQKGLRILYTGLDSAIFRQIFYGSARLGSYNFTIQHCKNNKIQINKLQKVLIAMISGIFGALVGNPFDVALIRKQASINNNKKNKIQYTNTFDAFRKMIIEEGVISLWTGIKITILRVVLINIGQLTSKQIISDQIVGFIPRINKLHQDNLSAILASVLTSLISLPADNIKVKLQKQHKDCQVYKGIVDCLLKSLRNQGFMRLWVGFPIYLARGFPHSFVLIRTQQFLSQTYEQSKMFRQYH